MPKIVNFDVVVIGGGPAGAISALECSKRALRVLLIEKRERGRYKPCGGLLTPICVEFLSEIIEKEIPRKVICSPETLGLLYVPPSGRKNSGPVRNYKLLNIHRDLFDQWLLEEAEETGAMIWYDTEFIELQQSNPLKVLVRKNRNHLIITTKYVIGADGVYSRLRSKLYKNKVAKLQILQETWKAYGDFSDNYYVFYGETISSHSAYIIPKNSLYTLGVAALNSSSTPRIMSNFRKRLTSEFTFKPHSLEKKESWPIPYGFFMTGKGNAILVGDAAGFCNPLSGEGIRLAIESSFAAGSAVQETIPTRRPLILAYNKHTEPIKNLLTQIHKFTINLDDLRREEFVKSQIKRISSSQA